MRVLIAGAGGAMGLTLIERLIADGHEVTGLTHSPERGRAIRSAGADSILCDVLLERQLTAAVERVQPEAIIHELSNLPERVDPRQAAVQLAPVNRLRREGTRNLIAAAQTVGAGRLLAQSIAFAYATEGEWVKDEQAPLALHSTPGQRETVAAVAELEAQVLAGGGIALRLGHLYGPGTPFGATGHYAELARKRQLPIVGSGEGRWSFIHPQDAAAATALALERGRTGIYNVVDDEPAPARDWIPVFAEALGAKRPLKLPDPIGARMLDPLLYEAMRSQRGASNAKARAELGWTPGQTWRQGFKTMIAAEQRERWRWAR